MSRPLRIALILTLLAAPLAACGKRGHLDPPPGSTSAPAAEQNKLGGKKRTPITAPKRDLAIDWILG